LVFTDTSFTRAAFGARRDPLLEKPHVLVVNEPVKRQAGLPFIRKEARTGSFTGEPWVALRAGRWLNRVSVSWWQVWPFIVSRRPNVKPAHD